MKKCCVCGVLKDDSEFHKDRHMKDGLSSQCKTCRKEIKHNYYVVNKDKLRSKHNAWRRSRPDKLQEYGEKRLIENRTFIDSLKSTCVKCGEDRSYLIQFHHINPSDKSFNLCNINSHGKVSLESESKKCVCLCANCHTEFHWIYGNNPLKPIEALVEYLGGDPYEIQLQQSRVLRTMPS